MKLMRYVNLYKTIEQDGELYEVMTKTNVNIPIIVNPYKISSIEPFFTQEGKPYKNVSIISYETGEKFRVVGNYTTLNDTLFKVSTNPIGFNNGKQTKEKIEDRTQIKSTVKRRAKTSSS